MKIIISGSHGVGKTTLLNELKKEPKFNNFVFKREVTRDLAKLGVPINTDGVYWSQYFIMLALVEHTFMYDNFIADRGSSDCMSYTRYLYNQGKITRENLSHLYKIHQKLLSGYDLIFFIRREFPIVADDIRTDDTKFAADIDEEFERAFDEATSLYPERVFLLSGTIDQRKKQFMDVILNHD